MMVTQARNRNKIASYDAKRPTAAAYGAMQDAFDFFNTELFTAFHGSINCPVCREPLKIIAQIA